MLLDNDGNMILTEILSKWVRPCELRRRAMDFQAMYFIVEKIDGDYAYLKRTDEEQEEPRLVARALLPDAIMEGSKIKYEMLQYEIIG